MKNNEGKSLITTTIALIMTITGLIASVVGIIFFFRGNTDVTCVCAVLTIVDSVVQCIWGDQKNLVTEIAAVIIGAILSAFLPGGFLALASVALCIETVAFTVIGWLAALVAAIFIR